MNPAQTMTCPECGKTVLTTDQFCSKCYARLEPPSFWRKLLSLFRPPVKAKAQVLNVKKTVTIKGAVPASAHLEYRSLDEVPPKEKAAIEGAGVVKNEALMSGGIVEETKGVQRVFRKKSFLVYKIKDASGQEQIYHSMDELPWEKRSQIEKLGSEAMKEADLLASETLEEAKNTPGIINQKRITIYKVKDASGQERIYHSLDELPPEIRKAFQRAQNQLE